MSTKWLKSFVFAATLGFTALPITAADASIYTPLAELKQVIQEKVGNIDPEEAQTKDMDPELLCMAETVYRESGKESELGKLAVAQAIKNRMESPLYPGTACKVVKMRTKIGERIVCQFSPYCSPRPALPTNPGHKNYPDWVESVVVAKLVLGRTDLLDITKGAQSFYAHNLVKPNWSGRVTLRIGGHTFVRTH